MATVKTLIAALLFGGNQPTFQFKCSATEPKNGFFHKTSLPLRRAASQLLHPHQCLKSLNLEEDNRLLVGTWPTYANQSFIHLTGYAYAVPICANDPVKQHGVFESCVGYLGGHVSDDQGCMPLDFLSHSVSGARITMAVGMGELRLTNGLSGEYGHFQTFVGHKEPVGEIDLQVATSDCPLNDLLQPVFTQTTAQVVAPGGVTIVSDVDDVLRECEVWNPKQMLLSTFARPFQPWSNEPWLNMSSPSALGLTITIAHNPLGSMPRVYEQWANSAIQDGNSNIHFHYVSEAPEISHRFYVDGINKYYPSGSFDLRPMVLDSYNRFMNSRYESIRRLIETFPERHFVLVGDTSTPSMLESYRRLAEEFDQVQCILIRDASATEPANWFAHDLTQHLKKRFVVFNTPHELLTNPSMNVTRLLQVLSKVEGKGVRCGELQGHEVEEKHMRKAVIFESAKTGVNRYFTCWLLTLGGKRPSKHCYFDRRGLLKYVAVEGGQ